MGPQGALSWTPGEAEPFQNAAAWSCTLGPACQLVTSCPTCNCHPASHPLFNSSSSPPFLLINGPSLSSSPALVPSHLIRRHLKFWIRSSEHLSVDSPLLGFDSRDPNCNPRPPLFVSLLERCWPPSTADCPSSGFQPSLFTASRFLSAAARFVCRLPPTSFPAPVRIVASHHINTTVSSRQPRSEAFTLGLILHSSKTDPSSLSLRYATVSCPSTFYPTFLGRPLASPWTFRHIANAPPP